MGKITIPQEDSDHILAVGHKVTYQGKECVITDIRVWHDMGTLLGRPFRGKPVFDMKGDGWSVMNIPIDDLDLWFPKPPMPVVPGIPTEGVKKLCDNCGQPIEPVRLKTLPETNLCLSCKAQEEKKAKDDKGHKRVKQSRAGPATQESG